MAKLFEFFGNLANPNKKADREAKKQQAEQLAAEQEAAMRRAQAEAEKKRKENEALPPETQD